MLSSVMLKQFLAPLAPNMFGSPVGKEEGQPPPPPSDPPLLRSNASLGMG